MATARDTALEALRENGGSMTLLALGRLLAEKQVLGFGVEAKDVVLALVQAGKAGYRPADDMVFLIRKAGDGAKAHP